MANEHKATMKSISKLIAYSSQSFLSALLDDSKDKENKEKERQLIIKQLQLAIAQKSLVVLQLKEDPSAQKFETVSGWILSKSFTDTLMIRSQKDTQQIKMVAVDHIRKVSVLAMHNRRITQ